MYSVTVNCRGLGHSCTAVFTNSQLSDVMQFINAVSNCNFINTQKLYMARHTYIYLTSFNIFISKVAAVEIMT